MAATAHAERARRGRRRALAMVVAFAALAAFHRYGRSIWYPPLARLRGLETVASRVATLGAAVDARLGPRFGVAGVPYPPAQVALVAFKRERVLELWAPDADGRERRVHAYRVLAASGEAGPKLREGDRQVPEGVYRVDALNPNSSYHLSLRLDYPNAFDRAHGARDGRTDLGGDIFVHGKAASIGCLAVGDAAAEELFVLAARLGVERVSVVIAPQDFRGDPPPPPPRGAPAWVPDLYAAIGRELARYPAPAAG